MCRLIFNELIGLTHLAFGLLVSQILQKSKLVRIRPLEVIFLLAGALFPDIDMPFSFIGRIFGSLSFKLNEKVGHRSATHSLFTLGHLALAWLLTFNLPILLFTIGYASHILLDLFNKMGVKLLWPLGIYFVLLDGKVKTGEKLDYGLFLTFSLLASFPDVLFYPLNVLE